MTDDSNSKIPIPIYLSKLELECKLESGALIGNWKLESLIGVTQTLVNKGFSVIYEPLAALLNWNGALLNWTNWAGCSFFAKARIFGEFQWFPPGQNVSKTPPGTVSL
jgi:hypothetical protein